MHSFLAVTKNEFSKLLAKKKYIVFFIIQILICAVMVLIQLVLERVSDGVIRFGFISLSMSMLTFFISVYIPLMVFMAASDLFSSEFHDGSIRAALMRPVSRFKVFSAKICAVMAMALVYLVSLFVVTVALEVIFGGEARNFWHSFGAYLLDVFPLAIVVLMAAFINQLTKSPTLAMLLSIIIYLVLIIAGTFIPQLSGMLFTGYAQWHSLFLGKALPVDALISKIGLLLGYGVVFTSAGFLLFWKRDV